MSVADLHCQLSEERTMKSVNLMGLRNHRIRRLSGCFRHFELNLDPSLQETGISVSGLRIYICFCLRVDAAAEGMFASICGETGKWRN